jgi:hypothetical protein
MRDLHARMLGAVLGGEGLEGVTELAAVEAGGPVAIVLPARGLADEVRGSLLEDLRAGRVGGGDAARRAARLGCDLSQGAVALVAAVRSARPRHAAA